MRTYARLAPFSLAPVRGEEKGGRARDPVRVLSVFSLELGDARGTRARPKPLNLLTRASRAAPHWVAFLAFDSHPLPPFTQDLSGALRSSGASGKQGGAWPFSPWRSCRDISGTALLSVIGA